jgi:hypothetical protein
LIYYSAIKKDNKIYVGKRHGECFAKMTRCGVKNVGIDSVQGFITNKGKFVDREEAYKIAKSCGQYKREQLCSEDCALSTLKILFSEDLW